MYRSSYPNLASAIQGDQEKCKSDLIPSHAFRDHPGARVVWNADTRFLGRRAGMDDYLSKPVRGKVLEKMLVKWAIEGRKRRTESPLSQPSSKKVDTGQDDESSIRSDVVLTSNEDRPRHIDGQLATSHGVRPHLSSDLRREEQEEREERSMALRDDKLLHASDDPRKPPPVSRQPSSTAVDGVHALTLENVSTEQFDSTTDRITNHAPDGAI